MKNVSWMEQLAWILLAYTPFTLILLFVPSLEFGEFWFSLPAFALFIVVPMLDFILPKQKTVYRRDELSGLAIWLLRLAPIIFCIAYVFISILILETANTLTITEFIFAAISMGAIGSIAITAAHECVHKTHFPEYLIGRMTMAFAGEPGFHSNHPYGHHKNACTPMDVSTAELGEGFYAFLFRTIKGCFVVSWQIQRKSNERKRLRFIRNAIVLAELLTPILLTILFSLTFSFQAGLLWFSQAALAVILLECIAYIQHYGLSRCRGDGSITKMEPKHNWNCYSRASSHMTFMLTRHADHHRMATKPFYLLETNEEAFELPMGYPSMVTLALVPPAWFKVMNPLLSNKSG